MTTRTGPTHTTGTGTEPALERFIYTRAIPGARMDARMAYQLRWGKATWIPVLAVGAVLGVMILLMSYWGMGSYWHYAYYVPLLGYYVMWSICQSHYFKCDPQPNWGGFARQWVSITSAVLIFYVNEWIIGDVVGIRGAYPADVAPNIIMAGHFTFIVLGFFFFGMDDFMFKGALSKGIKNDAHKAILWFAVIWITWIPVYAIPGVWASAMDGFDGAKLNMFLACFQWTIMMQMMTAITWRDLLGETKFKSDYHRGAIMLAIALAMGAIIGFFCYSMIDWISPEIPASNIWHHVLYMGTYPLIPIIMFGVYSNHFNHIPNTRNKTIARTAVIAMAVVAWDFAFRFIVAPSGIFGEHTWDHHFDLYFNFTISILPLSHHWFCGRLGALKEVPDAK